MKRFLKFFLGTPKRFLATGVAVAALAAFVHFQPGVLEAALVRLFNEAAPVLFSIAVLWIVLVVLTSMIRGIFRIPGGKK